MADLMTTLGRYKNPYRKTGNITVDGLDYIIAHFTGPEYTYDLATDFITGSYTSSVLFAQETISVFGIEGWNVLASGCADNLGGIDLNGGFSSLLLKIFNMVNCYPPIISSNTTLNSSVIFKDFTGNWGAQLYTLQEEIYDSGLSREEQILPSIAHAVLEQVYLYWQDVYNNTGGTNAWHTYILTQVGSIDDINWRQVIQQAVKGALVGAILGGQEYQQNQTGGIMIGAATTGMVASSQDLINQVTFMHVVNPAG